MMQRRFVAVILFVLALFFPSLLLIALFAGSMSSAYTSLASALFVSTATPVSTQISQTAQSSAGGGLDPAIIGGVMSGVGVILAAIITGIFIVYQTRRTRHMQAEMVRLQHELGTQAKTKEREAQTEAEKAEALRLAALSAQTTEERVDFYRKALQADPRISCMQILSMSRPLEVANVYIRVRLHEEVHHGYELDADLLEAERGRDPNILLQAGRRYLESRTGSALDPDEAIRRYHHCVIVGDPGAGKTTLLKFLALQSVDKHLTDLPDIPIHIGLNDFVNSGYRDLLDFAAATWDERYGFPKDDARKYMEEMLKKGQALLLLDALDETVTGKNVEEAEASYRRVADTIMQLKARYSESPIVVTARKAGYHGRVRLIGFTELEVLDFRQEDIEQFIDKWFAHYQYPNKYGNASDLKDKLQRTPRIQALAANPLLLSLIVLVYQAQLDLPDRRAELYKRCVDILLTEWDTSRGLQRRREFKPEYKQQLLEEIAWHFHLQGQRYFPDNELRQLIAEFLPTVNLPAEENGRILDEIANENGLLKEQAQGWHGFLHLTLQEYFAAKYATEHNELDTLLEHRGDPWWEEVFQLYAGQVPDASALLQKLLGQALREDIFHTNLLLAGRCLATRPRIRQVELREEVISRLFDLLRLASYSLTREQAIKTLAMVGGVEVKKQLLSLLADRQLDLDTLWEIIGAIGELEDDQLVSDLMKLLPNEQLLSKVRQEIARMLGYLGDKSIVPGLMDLLVNKDLDSDGWVGWGITQALSELGDEALVPDLMNLLTDKDLKRMIGWGITQALETLGDKLLVPDLITLLASNQLNPLVRRGIARTLGSLGDKSLVPDLMIMLANKQLNQDVAWGIAEALEKLGDKSIVPDLMILLADKSLKRWTGRGIADALGELGDKSLVPDLMSLLADKQLDPVIGEWIARTLGRLGDKSLVPDLITLLADRYLNQIVGWGISQALEKLGDKAIVPDLMGLLTDNQIGPLVRQGIARTLRKLGDKTIVSDLINLLVDKQLEADISEEIAQTLGQFAEDEVSVISMATIMFTSGIADSIHRALWAASRRAQVSVYVVNGLEGKRVEVVKW